MGRLEDLTRGASIRGILPDGAVTVVDVEWFGDAAVEMTYKDAAGHPGNQLVYRDDEPSFDVVSAGRPWSFDGDGELLRLVSEAHRIRLAYLFDRRLAVHTSLVDPLPHQIEAVSEEMLPRRPLRFLLADARTVTRTKDEILTALNKPDDFVLALVRVDGPSATAASPRHVRRPFTKEPDFGATGAIYDLPNLLGRGKDPA